MQTFINVLALRQAPFMPFTVLLHTYTSICPVPLVFCQLAVGLQNKPLIAHNCTSWSLSKSCEKANLSFLFCEISQRKNRHCNSITWSHEKLFRFDSKTSCSRTAAPFHQPELGKALGQALGKETLRYFCCYIRFGKFLFRQIRSHHPDHLSLHSPCG